MTAKFPIRLKMQGHFNILILGTGSFGTCLAQHLSNQGQKVLLLGRDQNIANCINQHHQNPKHLSQYTLHQAIYAISDIKQLPQSKFDLIIVAIPTQYLKETLGPIRSYLSSQNTIVSAVKGIEMDSLYLPTRIITREFPDIDEENLIVLSGPNFATEIMEYQPTCVVFGGRSPKNVENVVKIFHAPHFRSYTSDDPTGLEVAGALKNIIAIASGAAAALGFQSNSQAALITRGLAEITRVGVALNANPLTFNGLGGVGDLFLTCSSPKSRNYTYGYNLVTDTYTDQPEILKFSVPEGVTTAKSAFKLVRSLDVDAPIITAVYNVIYKNQPVKEAVTELLSRQAKPEITLPFSKNPT